MSDVDDTEPSAPCSGAISLAITSSTIVELKDLRLKQTSLLAEKRLDDLPGDHFFPLPCP